MMVTLTEISDHNSVNPTASTSAQFDDFDSVSQRSYQSTVLDSDIVEAEVKRYEKFEPNQVQATVNPAGLQNNQINLSIQVINNNNPNSSTDGDSNSQRSTTESRRNLNKKDKSTKFNNLKFVKNRKFLIAFVITVLIGVITGVVVVIMKNKNENNENELTTLAGSATESTEVTTGVTTSSQATTTTESPITSSQSQETTTTDTTAPSTSPTTTENPADFYEILPKSVWNSTVQPKDPLKPPIDIIIVLETITNACQDKQNCSKFLKNRQSEFWNQNHDRILMTNLPENYYISTTGLIFEGRGFYEGQHTYDKAETNYNRNSVGISFIVESPENELNERQIGAFKYLVEELLSSAKVAQNYKIYHKIQLAGGKETKLSKTVETWNNWKQTPKIIRRNEWNAAGRPVSGSKVIMHSKTVVFDSGELNCFDLEICGVMLRQRQTVDLEKFGDIRHNFIFAGENLLFEGRSFDINNAFSEGLQVLFLGNFTENTPPGTIMEIYENLLDYAIDLKKLDENFLLYGDRQLNRDTRLIPGDALFDILQKPPFDKHFDFNTTEPPPCIFGCG